MKFFHEISNEERNKLISEKRSLNYISEYYKQPEWCDYPEALLGALGCWSLNDLGENGTRVKISEEFCKNCDMFCHKNNEK